jgi:hypothetical protein
VDSLAGSGSPHEASRLLLKSGLGKAFAAEPLALLRLRWVEGKILLGLDRVSRAEKTLKAARKDFLDLGRDYAAALVTLDLIPLWLREGKTREVRKGARQAYDVLREIGIDHEAARARAYLM